MIEDPANIVITQATREDVPALHQMLGALGTVLNRAQGVRSTEQDIAHFGFDETPAFEALVARHRGEPVGFVLYFEEFSTWRGCRGVYVQDLYVADDSRGRGLGKRLLGAVVARAAARGSRYLRLSVDDGNDRGTGFYERIGFSASDEQLMVLEGDAFAAMSGSEEP